MKKKGTVFALLLLLALSLCTPALATRDYGVIYDETEMLGSPTLTMQGEQTLPQLSGALGIDLRVDVLTQIDDDTVDGVAMWIYEAYEYGYGDHKEGVTLTILLEQQDADTYVMPTDGWCVYATLRQGRGNSQDLADAIYYAVKPCMAEQAWNGEDMTMSAVALTQAVDAMAEAAEDYILTNCPPDAPGAEVPEEAEEPEQSGTEESQAPEESSVDMEYVFDVSDLLSYEEWDELESRAAAISEHQHCGVYFALVDDYRDYGDGDVYEVTYQLYHSNQLGIGDDRNGIFVLLSMNERDYAMFVYGEYAEYAFDEFGQERLEERFLGTFGDDDWYGGISNYLDACDEFLTKAQEGEPVRPAYWMQCFIATGVSCLVAGVICFFLMGRMKTVHKKTEANAYLTKGGLNLTEQYDRYTHTTETSTKIEKDNSSSSQSESGGGGSGRSGKF